MKPKPCFTEAFSKRKSMRKPELPVKKKFWKSCYMRGRIRARLVHHRETERNQKTMYKRLSHLSFGHKAEWNDHRYNNNVNKPCKHGRKKESG